jgi:hypothetical protein
MKAKCPYCKMIWEPVYDKDYCPEPIMGPHLLPSSDEIWIVCEGSGAKIKKEDILDSESEL